MFHIRPATFSDAKALAKVHIDTWRSAYAGIIPQDYLDGLSYERREERWRQIFAANDPRCRNFIAESDGKVIGFGGTGPNRSIEYAFDGELYALYLSADFQGRGIGKNLFLKAIQFLKEDGFSSMLVWVLKDNPARCFYLAMGGKEIGEKWDEIGGKRLKEVALGWKDLDQLC